jgi:hypothetical protein
MNKKAVIAAVAGFAIAGGWAAQKYAKKPTPVEKSKVAQLDFQPYWTCPMHPQIHADHAGECPICHMKLVQVRAQQAQAAEESRSDARVPVAAGGDQIALLGIQRAEVEKMNLRVKIPVSGRFVSSSSVAFQIYESDLRYVKAGLPFKGESSFYPEEEVTGVISSVDSIVDPTSRTIRVVGAVKKGPRGSLSETGFRGEIEMELKDRVAIPESAVLHTGEGDLVYLFTKGSELSPLKVKLGLKSEGFYDVLDGLEPGQYISSGPNFLLDSESKIRGASMPKNGEDGKPAKPSTPSCPNGEHWDIPMSMCMPGKG